MPPLVSGLINRINSLFFLHSHLPK
uniref:Uncharacterized protein n=1 Tax=Anguilla anguilla TaxID=7936 RepID=A0A0E9RK50_ANGAN